MIWSVCRGDCQKLCAVLVCFGLHLALIVLWGLLKLGLVGILEGLESDFWRVWDAQDCSGELFEYGSFD